MRSAAVFVSLCVPFVACSAPRERSTSAGPHEAPHAERHESSAAPSLPPPTAVAPAKAPEWLAKFALESNGEAYVLHIDPAPASIVDNETFALEVWIARASAPSELARDVALSVDAAMPEHGHGMNRIPKITRVEEGHFRVEGLLFHMTGHWELYFDVTHGAVTERAQCDVVLE